MKLVSPWLYRCRKCGTGVFDHNGTVRPFRSWTSSQWRISAIPLKVALSLPEKPASTELDSGPPISGRSAPVPSGRLFNASKVVPQK
jgi:hypothetical protein